jgi:hypothetical protein
MGRAPNTGSSPLRSLRECFARVQAGVPTGCFAMLGEGYPTGTMCFAADSEQMEIRVSIFLLSPGSSRAMMDLENQSGLL